MQKISGTVETIEFPWRNKNGRTPIVKIMIIGGELTFLWGEILNSEEDMRRVQEMNDDLKETSGQQEPRTPHW